MNGQRDQRCCFWRKLGNSSGAWEHFGEASSHGHETETFPCTALNETYHSNLVVRKLLMLIVKHSNFFPPHFHPSPTFHFHEISGKLSGAGEGLGKESQT